MNFTQWIVGVVAIIISAYLLPGVQVTLIGAVVLAVVLALINIFIKPFIFILTLPINILTLGLFSFVINALLIMLASGIVPGFAVASFWSALLFSVVLSLVSMLFGTKRKER